MKDSAVLRYGANDASVLERLRWLQQVAPACAGRWRLGGMISGC
jgi:hypothetical protein